MSHSRKLALSAVALFVVGAVLFPFVRSQSGVVDKSTGSDVSFEEPKQTGADQFALYHQQIRTHDGDIRPAYGPNYQIEELKRARRTAKTSFQQIPWEEHGPSNVGGRTRAIVIDSGDPTGETWIAASVSGGIWRTTNSGETWSHLTPELPNLAFSSMVQSASDPDIMYAGSGEGFFNGDASVGAGIFKSTNRGLSWTQLPSTAAEFGFRYVNRIIVSPVDPLVIIAATRSGVARSTDGGNSWVFTFDSTDGATGNLQVVAHPDQFSIMYAHDSGEGVIRSTDGGLNWAPAAVGLEGLDGFEEGRVTDVPRIEMAIAPSDPDRLYALVESEGGGERIFMSTNTAETWVELEMDGGVAKTDIASTQGWYDLAIAVHPVDENILYVGGIHLYQVTLAGETASGTLTNFEEEDTASFLAFTSFNSAGHFDGFLRTGLTEDNSGTTEADFTSVEIRFGPGLSQNAHRFIPPDGPGIPFQDYPYANYVSVPFEIWDITNNRQLMVSFRDRLGDGEYDFTPDSPVTNREYIIIHAVDYDEAAPHPSIGVDGGPVHKMLYFVWPDAADDTVWDPAQLPLSTVRITFENQPVPLRTVERISFSSSVHADQHFILPTRNEQTGDVSLLVGNDGGVFESADAGSSWKAQGIGYNTSQFYGVDKINGLKRFIGGTQDNGTWLSKVNPSASTEWVFKIGGDGFEVAWNQEDASFLLGASQYNNFRRSTNGGFSFASGTSGLGDVGSTGGGQFLTTMARSHDEPFTVFTIGESGVWKSKDFAASWSLRPIPEEDWGFGGSGKVRVSIANSANVWAGYEMDPFQNDAEDNLGKLHLSQDFGDTFVAVPTPENLSPGRISGIATHPHLASTAFVLFSASQSPKILRTDDLGQTWRDISGFDGSIDGNSLNGFPDVAVHDLLVIPDRHYEIWAGTGIGLFISRDNGLSWSIADNGLPAVAIWRMRVVDGRVLMATHGRGVWSVDLAQTVAVEEDLAGSAAGNFQLVQNYPNPFSTETTISFTLPSPETVTLTVVDISGRLVETLINEALSVGPHKQSFRAAHLASGTYFYTLRAGEYSETKKMIVLK